MRFLVIILLFAVAGCTSYPATDQHREFSLVAEVETPEGIKSGRSEIVLSRTDYENNNWCSWMCPGPPTKFDISGEAVVVDLPRGRNLIVLLSSNIKGNWLKSNSPQIENDVNAVGYCKKSGSFENRDLDKDGCVDFPVHTEIPYFVTLLDNENFSSIKEVDPYDLAKTFGSGTKLKSLRLEPTREGNSRILERFPWVSRLVETESYYYLEKDSDKAPPFPNGIGRQSFKQGSH